MTRAEAVVYLEGMVPQNTDVIMLDPVQWVDFKASMLAVLAEGPTEDPALRAALEAANIKIDEANAIVDGALG